MIKTTRWALALALLAFSLQAFSAPSNSRKSGWQGFRGGHDVPRDVLPSTFGLVSDWTQDLGAGYSSVAVAEGLVVAPFTSGEEDVLAAFRAEDGSEVWRLRLADKYVGHSGSDDGPLATPAIDGDQVFILGPKGQLVAASLADGKELWRVQLDESNSNVPFYGYTSSPLPVDDVVVVLAGGEDRAVAAYDRKTGAPRWSTGSDSVTYQSPILAQLGGHSQIVAVTDQWAFGLDPKNGQELWKFEHSSGETREGSAHPTQIGTNRILVNMNNESLALDVASKGGQWMAQEAWRSRALAGSLVLPVVNDGHLFGFTGRILTAADADSGEILWRTRAVQALNLSLIDGRLAMVSGDGHLVMAEATGEEYRETARIKVFDRGDYADPAFAGGRLYLRNQSHLAAVKVDAQATPQVAQAEEDPHKYLGRFGEFVQSLEAKAVAERQAAVDAYFAKAEGTPLVEESGAAHIIYRGEAEDVGVQGTIFGWSGQEVSLHRVDGTDLFYRSLDLDPKGGYEYALTVDYGRPGADPANPHTIDGFATLSELRMPHFRANETLAEPAEGASRGTLHEFRFHSEALGNSRNIQVWAPSNLDAETRYPLLVVNHGNNAVRSGLMNNTLDHLVGQKVRPMVVAFVPRNGPAEYNGDRAPDYARFLVEELVPHLERHYQASDERAIMGPGSAGVISLHTAMAYPGVFGKVATQSFYLTDANRDAYWQMLEGSEAQPMVWVESGPNDYVIAGPGIDAQRSSKALVERLQKKGIEVQNHEVHGAAGWMGWRNQTDLILEAFFPADS